MEQTGAKPPEDELEDSDALEQGASLEGGEEIIDARSDSPSRDANTPPPIPPKQKGIKARLAKTNIYIFMFFLIIVIAGIILVVAYFQNKKASTTSTIASQTLTQGALDKVAGSDASVGSSQQVLNVLSSAIFSGKVLVREDLEVAGGLRIGGTVSINNLSVNGSAQFNQAQISQDFSVGGNSAVQGSSTVGKSLQVKGEGNFSGAVSAPQVTTSALNLNGDLVITRHIVIGGGTPATSNGTALGSGGSASVSGSDTAGTINVKVGSSAPAGCFATIRFTQRFGDTPHIILTPVGSAGGSIPYYVNRDPTSFSVCTSSPTSAGASFGFDYFIVD